MLSRLPARAKRKCIIFINFQCRPEAKTFLVFEKTRALWDLLIVFSKITHLRLYLGKIWRNWKFWNCRRIFDIYRNWLLKQAKHLMQAKQRKKLKHQKHVKHLKKVKYLKHIYKYTVHYNNHLWSTYLHKSGSRWPHFHLVLLERKLRHHTIGYDITASRL